MPDGSLDDNSSRTPDRHTSQPDIVDLTKLVDRITVSRIAPPDFAESEVVVAVLIVLPAFTESVLDFRFGLRETRKTRQDRFTYHE